MISKNSSEMSECSIIFNQEIDIIIVDYTFQCYVFKMINLIDLEMNLRDSGINNDMGIKMSSGLGKLSKLEKLNLGLKDNYIDNIGFEEMLENLELIQEVVLDVVLNNIV